MSRRERLPRSVRLISGLVAGVAIAGVDNYAFGGEVSPIVIVALLFLVLAGMGALWGKAGIPPAVIVWVCVPVSHAAKHALGLPDSLHPNTYLSILELAGFTLAVSCVGALLGLLLNRVRNGGDGTNVHPSSAR